MMSFSSRCAMLESFVVAQGMEIDIPQLVPVLQQLVETPKSRESQTQFLTLVEERDKGKRLINEQYGGKSPNKVNL